MSAIILNDNGLTVFGRVILLISIVLSRVGLVMGPDRFSTPPISACLKLLGKKLGNICIGIFSKVAIAFIVGSANSVVIFSEPSPMLKLFSFKLFFFRI